LKFAIGIVCGFHAYTSQPSWAAEVAFFKASSLSAELAFYIAETGKTDRIVLAKGTDLLEVITKRCGKANAAGPYIAVFSGANNRLSAIQHKSFVLTADDAVTFPACAYANQSTLHVPVTSSGPLWFCDPTKMDSRICANVVQPDLFTLQAKPVGLSYAAQLGLPATASGTTAINTMSAVRLRDSSVASAVTSMVEAGLLLQAAGKISFDPAHGHRWAPDAAKNLPLKHLTQQIVGQDIRLANTTLDGFNTIQSGSTLARPANAAGGFSFELRTGVDPSIVVATLNKLAGNNESGGGIVQAILPTSASCGTAAFKSNWPYSVTDLKTALLLAEASYKRHGLAMPAPGKVLVVDTGFPPSAIGVAPFSENYFVTDPTTAAKISTFAYYKNFKNILDLVERDSYSGDPLVKSRAFVEGVEHSTHGLAVATLALGGIELLRDPPGTRRSMVMPAVAYRAKENEMVADTTGIELAISGDGWRNLSFEVVNLSFKYLHRHGRSIGSQINQRSSTLYVAAAGNEQAGGRNLALTQILPAALGGRAQKNIITVTSVDPNGELSSFANFSGDYVDLAAPGCQVPVFGWNRETGKVKESLSSGTSLAAPLVSFVASLLAKEDGMDPSNVKRRIVASSDYNEALRNKVWSSGSLNPAKAVSTALDVIETTTGKLIFGRIDWNSRGQSTCNQIMSPPITGDAGRLLKISRISSASATEHLLRLTLKGLQPWAIDFIDECKSKDEFSTVKIKEVSVENGIAVGTMALTQVLMTDVRDITFCEVGRCVQL